MVLQVTANSVQFENAPEGQYVARLYKVVDKGTQPTFYKGQETGQKRMLMLAFELHNLQDPTSKTTEGKPFSVNTTVPASLDARANFLKFARACLGADTMDKIVEKGTPVSPKDLLGKALFLRVKHKVGGNGVTYANIDTGTISEIQMGVQVPDQVNESVYLSLDADEFDAAVYDSLSDHMKETISASPEYKALNNTSANVVTQEVSIDADTDL